jgi:arylsulfatase A-like enzyme
MPTRNYFQRTGIYIAVLFICIAGARADSNDLAGTRPNIILVMTDDQGYGDLGCHGHPLLQTPNLDTLYAQSTRFTSFHASPSCSPTRAALLSGQLPFRNGITHTILERERMALSATTIAEVLRNGGYATGIFGKWHLGDEDAYQPDQRGFEEVFIHGGGSIGEAGYPGSGADVPGNTYFDPVIKHNGTFVKTSGYCTDVFFRQMLGWIKAQKDSGKPFFAYLPSNAPHNPYIVEDKYKQPYIGKVSDQSASFFGMIANIDENMGLLMEKLDEWELADKTLLIFMTDNGSAAGTYNAGMKGGKLSAHEGGSRVPLFMRLPGQIASGVDIDTLTRHVDIFPTLAEFAGIAPSGKLRLEGQSLVPLLRNAPGTQHDDRLLFFHLGRWPKQCAPGVFGAGIPGPDAAKFTGFAVRSKRWRLVGKNLLYDMQNDPGEAQNVIADHPEVAGEMLAAYEAWWGQVRPFMVNENETLNKNQPFVEQFNKQKTESGIPDWIAPQL